MKPEDARPTNFYHFTVLYDDGDFAIAWGKPKGTEDSEKRLAMRWNKSPTQKGYPYLFRHAMWFDFSDELTPDLLRVLSRIKKKSQNQYLNMAAIKQALIESEQA